MQKTCQRNAGRFFLTAKARHNRKKSLKPATAQRNVAWVEREIGPTIETLASARNPRSEPRAIESRKSRVTRVRQACSNLGLLALHPRYVILRLSVLAGAPLFDIGNGFVNNPLTLFNQRSLAMSQYVGTIHIESPRLSIKPFSSDDADVAFPCITPALTRFMSWEPPASRENFDQIWRSWLPTIEDGSDFVFAIRVRRDGQFLGLAGLHHVQTNMPELGIWIREDRHGEGFGGEAVAQVAQWATQTRGIQRFIYPVAEENRASRRIAESLGGVVIEQRTAAKYDSVVYQIPGQSAVNEA